MHVMGCIAGSFATEHRPHKYSFNHQSSTDSATLGWRKCRSLEAGSPWALRHIRTDGVWCRLPCAVHPARQPRAPGCPRARRRPAPPQGCRRCRRSGPAAGVPAAARQSHPRSCRRGARWRRRWWPPTALPAGCCCPACTISSSMTADATAGFLLSSSAHAGARLVLPRVCPRQAAFEAQVTS